MEVALPVIYYDKKFDIGFRLDLLDLLVNERVIIEIKSVEKLAQVHHKQVNTYIKFSNIKLGILVNFKFL
jgi:GxxExxY protein